MKKKIAILGSTGSIGKSLLKIIEKDKKNFEILLLSANKNYKSLLKQTKIFKVKNIIINDPDCLKKFKKINNNKNIKIFGDFNSFNKISKKKIDYVMISITGINGLDPTLKVIRYTKKIAIANKESIICGWNLIKMKLDRNKTKFLPVDSEHFSIWYALKEKNNIGVDRIYLTASGGPFLKYKIKNLNKVTPIKALKHPNWKMGNKISIDSATLTNKVFEVIEAKNIFNIPYSKLSILIHPKSYVHAVVKFKNGLTKIIIHDTEMTIPIHYTLYGDNKEYFKSNKLNFKKLNKLDFNQVDQKKFPVIKVLKLLPSHNSLFETVIVSANDLLVELFLKKKIKFIQISQILLKIINMREFKKLKLYPPKKVSDIINLKQIVNSKINKIVYKI